MKQQEICKRCGYMLDDDFVCGNCGHSIYDYMDEAFQDDEEREAITQHE